MPLMLMPFCKYADFRGRARLAEYWLFWLFQVIVYLIMIALVFIAAGSAQTLPVLIASICVPVALFALICLLPNLAVTVRRLHDTGKSAAWLLLYVPGLVNGGMGLFEGLKAGSDYATIRSDRPLFTLLVAVCNLVMLYILRAKGTIGPNRFGEDPKQSPLDLSVFDAPEEPELRADVHMLTQAYRTPASERLTPEPISKIGTQFAKPAQRMPTRQGQMSVSGTKVSFGKRH